MPCPEAVKDCRGLQVVVLAHSGQASGTKRQSKCVPTLPKAPPPSFSSVTSMLMHGMVYRVDPKRESKCPILAQHGTVIFCAKLYWGGYV